MLATPCATSSQFERCRRPLMLSATTAESRLSIAAQQREGERRSGSTAMSFSSEMAGRCGAGSECGMPPNRVPIVSTGRPSKPARHRGEPDRDQERRPVRPAAAQGQDQRRP